MNPIAWKTTPTVSPILSFQRFAGTIKIAGAIFLTDVLVFVWVASSIAAIGWFSKRA
jgi:hypothetical protein